MKKSRSQKSLKHIWIDPIFYADFEYDISFDPHPKIFPEIDQILVRKSKKLHTKTSVFRHVPSHQCWRSFESIWFCSFWDGLSNGETPKWTASRICGLSFNQWYLYLPYIYVVHPEFPPSQIYIADQSKITFLAQFRALIPNLRSILCSAKKFHTVRGLLP